MPRTVHLWTILPLLVASAAPVEAGKRFAAANGVDTATCGDK
jgi:hypothetical protein